MRQEKKDLEGAPSSVSRYKNMMIAIPTNKQQKDSIQSAGAKKSNRGAAVSISVNTTRTGDNNEQSYSVGVSPTVRRGNGREGKETLPARTFDESREDEIIELIEQHQRRRLEIDPMRELEEALMDRTTASLNRRNKMNSIKASGASGT